MSMQQRQQRQNERPRQQQSSGVYLPRADQRVEAGSDLMIQWFYGSDLRASMPPTIDIELRDAVSGFPLRTVATNAPNHGYFFWNVDQQIQACENAIVFVGNILAPHSAPSLFSAQFSLITHSDDSVDIDNAPDQPPLWSVSADSTTATHSVATFSQSNRQWQHEQRRPQGGSHRHLEESFSRMSLDEAQSVDCDSEDSLKCAQTHHHSLQNEQSCRSGSRNTGAEQTAAHAQSRTARSSRGESAPRAPLLSAPQEVREPIVWSHYPDFICYAMYMCDTEIRRGLKQVVKNKALNADSPLESGEPAGIFCVRYLLLKHCKTKISSDVFNAIRSKVYVPHPLLTRAWQRSPLFCASQRNPVRAVPRSRRARSAEACDCSDQSVVTSATSSTTTTNSPPSSQSPPPLQHQPVRTSPSEKRRRPQRTTTRRKQVVHNLTAGIDAAMPHSQSNMQTHAMRRPVTRSRLKAP